MHYIIAARITPLSKQRIWLFFTYIGGSEHLVELAPEVLFGGDYNGTTKIKI